MMALQASPAKLECGKPGLQVAPLQVQEEELTALQLTKVFSIVSADCTKCCQGSKASSTAAVAML